MLGHMFLEIGILRHTSSRDVAKLTVVFKHDEIFLRREMLLYYDKFCRHFITL